MRIINIILPRDQFDRWGNAGGQAIEMSAWCKEQGLTYEKDYDYVIMSAKGEIHFRFFNEHESMGSMFAMRWMR